MTLADVWREKISCIIHTSTQEEANMLFKAINSYDHNGTAWASWWNVYKKKTCYRTNLGEVVAYGCLDNYIGDDEEVIEFSDLVVTGGTLPTSEWSKLIFKNGSSIEVLPNTSDVVRGGNSPSSVKLEVVKDRTKTMKDWVDSLTDAWAKLGCTSFRVLPEEFKKEYNVKWIEEEKKMPTKFTFYVTEGTRVNKSCNGTIPTMTTTVEANSYSRTAPVGTATCDKADYDMRQGVLEALANMYCDGDFDKVYNKAVKRNELADKKKRTCKYCGKVFDTIEECETEEAWHVERKKARRERYLLRKRAKEIAFEEQAQKMAKKMIEEDK